LKTPEQLAKEHADWETELIQTIIIPIIRKVAYDNFLHGYKHGKEAKQ